MLPIVGCTRFKYSSTPHGPRSSPHVFAWSASALSANTVMGALGGGSIDSPGSSESGTSLRRAARICMVHSTIFSAALMRWTQDFTLCMYAPGSPYSAATWLSAVISASHLSSRVWHKDM
jgi:hypothetical protein